MRSSQTPVRRAAPTRNRLNRPHAAPDTRPDVTRNAAEATCNAGEAIENAAEVTRTDANATPMFPRGSPNAWEDT